MKIYSAAKLRRTERVFRLLAGVALAVSPLLLAAAVSARQFVEPFGTLAVVPVVLGIWLAASLGAFFPMLVFVEGFRPLARRLAFSRAVIRPVSRMDVSELSRADLEHVFGGPYDDSDVQSAACADLHWSEVVDLREALAGRISAWDPSGRCRLLVARHRDAHVSLGFFQPLAGLSSDEFSDVVRVASTIAGGMSRAPLARFKPGSESVFRRVAAGRMSDIVPQMMVLLAGMSPDRRSLAYLLVELDMRAGVVSGEGTVALMDGLGELDDLQVEAAVEFASSWETGASSLLGVSSRF